MFLASDIKLPATNLFFLFNSLILTKHDGKTINNSKKV